MSNWTPWSRELKAIPFVAEVENDGIDMTVANQRGQAGPATRHGDIYT